MRLYRLVGYGIRDRALTQIHPAIVENGIYRQYHGDGRFEANATPQRLVALVLKDSPTKGSAVVSHG
jgi:hypothetical protein